MHVLRSPYLFSLQFFSTCLVVFPVPSRRCSFIRGSNAACMTKEEHSTSKRFVFILKPSVKDKEAGMTLTSQSRLRSFLSILGRISENPSLDDKKPSEILPIYSLIHRFPRAKSSCHADAPRRLLLPPLTLASVFFT